MVAVAQRSGERDPLVTGAGKDRLLRVAAAPPFSGGLGGDVVLVELEEVVGGGDQAPFGADGGSASSVEAGEAAVVFGVAEQGLDQVLALAVERLPCSVASTRRMKS